MKEHFLLDPDTVFLNHGCAPKGTAFLHSRSEHHANLFAMVTSWGEVAPDGPSAWDRFIGRGRFERRM